MNSKNHLPLKGVYSWEKWTKPNPSIGRENPPADISSEKYHVSFRGGWMMQMNAHNITMKNLTPI